MRSCPVRSILPRRWLRTGGACRRNRRRACPWRRRRSARSRPCWRRRSPRSRNTLRAPSRIWRRFGAILVGDEMKRVRCVCNHWFIFSGKISTGHTHGKVLSLYGPFTQMYLDRTVRSMLILEMTVPSRPGFGCVRASQIVMRRPVYGRSERPGRTRCSATAGGASSAGNGRRRSRARPRPVGGTASAPRCGRNQAPAGSHAGRARDRQPAAPPADAASRPRRNPASANS